MSSGLVDLLPGGGEEAPAHRNIPSLNHSRHAIVRLYKCLKQQCDTSVKN